MVAELQNRQCAFICFFDANTIYTLEKAKKTDEADIFDGLCHDFPDLFIEVSGGTRADDYILDYAHSHGTPIISKDRFRDFEEKYPWLKSNSLRRVPFVIYSGTLQIVPMGIQAAIPTDLAAAESSLRAALGNPVPAKAPVEIPSPQILSKCRYNNMNPSLGI